MLFVVKAPGRQLSELLHWTVRSQKAYRAVFELVFCRGGLSFLLSGRKYLALSQHVGQISKFNAAKLSVYRNVFPSGKFLKFLKGTMQ